MSIPSPEPIRRFVRAGAGAGKTTNLTQQVINQALDFRSQTGRWPRTVLTTFTRKATQELKERMLLHCLKEKPEALEFVQSTSYLNITTMHGLLSTFLGRYGYVISLPNQLKIVDSKQGDFWRKQVLREMVDQFKQSQSLQLFNFSTLLQLLKKFESVYWLGGVQPLQTENDFETIMVDLMRPIGLDLQSELGQAKASEPGESWQDYFNSLEGLIESLLDPQPWSQWSEHLQSFFPLPTRPRKSKANPGLSKEMRDRIDHVLKELKKWLDREECSAQYWSQTMRVLKDFEVFARQFMHNLTQKKQQEGALEPNDLEFYSLRILREHPEVFNRFSQDVDAWYIDEFQDTSPLQLEILEPMIVDHSCYIVGDPQQSIYLFRGSRSEVFFEKHQNMEKQGADIQFLQNNYRSQAHLLEFFNQIFPAIDENFSTMKAQVSELNDQAAVVISEVKTSEPEAELHHLSSQLVELLQQGASPKDICILTRTHSHSDVLQKKLMALGFPVISHSSSNFYNRREVIDGLSLLKFLINPWDDKNLMLILRSPWLAFSDQQLSSTIADCDKNFWPLFKASIENQKSGPGRFLLKALEDVESKGYAWVFRRLLIELGLFDFCHQVDSTGRREANLWKLVNIVEKSAREPGSSLLQLIAQGRGASSLEELSEDGDASSPVEPDKIHLMTVHASKGLQFKYVFLPFLHKKPNESTYQDFTIDEDKKLWSLRMPLSETSKQQGGALEGLFIRSMKKREQEESLRVLYVAMTRAKDQLFMSWSQKTEKQSWAQILKDIEDQWRAYAHVNSMEVTSDPGPCYYQAEELDKSVRQAFDASVQRFPQEREESEGATQKPEPKTWQQVQTAQQRRREGVILHRLFESLKTVAPEQIVQLSKNWIPGRETDVSTAVEFVLSEESVPLLEIIGQGHVEWGYQRIENGLKIEKRVDLWGVVDDVLWIVDYKTGSTHYKASAFDQMTEYAKTLTTFLNWSGPVKQVAVYPFAQEIFVETWKP